LSNIRRPCSEAKKRLKEKEMRNSHSLAYIIFGGLLSVLFITGCGTTPSSRFYTLQPLQQGERQQSIAIEDKTIIGVGPVIIPDYIDRTQIVTRTNEDKLARAEFDRWAGSLRDDILRVLVENLSILLSHDRFLTVSWEHFFPMTYRVAVEITRFDVIPGKHVILSARWALYSKKDKTIILSRETDLNEPLEEKSYAAVVGAMSQTLAHLSRDIAEEIMPLVKNSR
jgi:uncharacterized lipoprotein YmbA